jgi:hypothetical protein
MLNKDRHMAKSKTFKNKNKTKKNTKWLPKGYTSQDHLLQRKFSFTNKMVVD